MKKRIISLALVVVMLLLTLCSCSFNYSKRDLTKYATFNSEKFFAELLNKSISIKDADFGTDEDARNLKVLDTIFKALASDAGTDEKVTDGAAGKYDVLYYGYFLSFEIEEKTGEKDDEGKDIVTKKPVYVMYEGLNPAKPGSVQFGLYETDKDSLAGKIEAAIGTTDIDSFLYSAEAEGTVADGDLVFISYTKSWTVPVYKTDADGNTVLDADGNPVPELNADGTAKTETKKESAVYKLLTAEKAAASTPDSQDDTTTEAPEKPTLSKTFEEQLIGQKVGKVKDLTVTEDGVEYKYSGIQVHAIVDTFNESNPMVKVTDKTFTATKKAYDQDGKEYDLKDKELTYYVFPMYIVDVADEITAEIVLKKLYGTDTDKDGTVEDNEKGNLEILTGEDYKNGEETVKALAEKLVTAYNELAKADKALTAAKEKEAEKTPTTDNKGDSTEGEGDTTTEGEPSTQADDTTEGEGETDTELTDLEKAQKTYDEKKAAVDELVTKILAAKNGENKTVGEVLADEYKEAVYDNLEASYISSITNNIAKEVFKIAESCITYNGLPKSAVKDAYKRIEDVHEYNFYQGTVSDTTTGAAKGQSNYDFYKGNYEAYLKVALGLKETDSVEACEAAMQKQAEEHVKELILVYTLANVIGDEVKLTKEQKESAKNNIYVLYLGVSEEEFLHATQFDNIMNYLLETEEKAEDSTDNTVKYKHLDYKFEEEKTEDSTTGDSTTDGEGSNG